MTIVLSEGAISLMTTDELVKQSFASLKVSALEIRPGQSKTCVARPRVRSEQSARTAHSTSPLATRIITGNSWGGFADSVENIADSRDGKDYRQRMKDSESVS